MVVEHGILFTVDADEDNAAPIVVDGVAMNGQRTPGVRKNRLVWYNRFAPIILRGLHIGV